MHVKRERNQGRGQPRRARWLLAAGLGAALLALPAAAGFPGPNGKLAFSSNRNGNFEIYTMSAAGGSATNLTQDAGDDANPAFSASGAKIAFVRATWPPASST